MILPRKTERSTRLVSPPESNDEIKILSRVLANGREFAPSLARHVLTLGFSEQERARMNDLASRNQEGTLSRQEQDELHGYAKAGCLLGILHQKARRALRKQRRK